MKQKIRPYLYLFAILGVLLMLTNGCNKKPVPVLNTTEVSLITQNTATCGGTITNDGGAMVTKRGVCWSTGKIPTIADSITSEGTGAGSFTSVITGLKLNSTYYVRAYATNNAGTGYGSSMTFTTHQILTDFDGNVYHAVTIGTQVWMVENLKAIHYRNGDPIPNVSEGKEWSKLKTGAFCDYKNISDNSITYGKLYNFYAVVNPRNLCPTGWHVPSDAEWTTLTNFLGGDVASGKLKEKGTTHWQSPNKGATNDSGFTALPGGCRGGRFLYIGKSGYWWTSSENNATTAWTRDMSFNLTKVSRSHFYKISGGSVRCIKDK